MSPYEYYGIDYQTHNPTGNTTHIYSFNITSAFQQWMKYSLNQGGYTFDIGFILRADRGVRIFKSTENSAQTDRPSVMVYYTEDTSLANGTYFIRGLGSGKYLDVAGGIAANGTNVQQHEFNGSLAQQWQVTHIGGGIYDLTPQIGGNFRLEAAGGVDANNTNVHINSKTTTNTHPYQQWRIISNGNGTYRIISYMSDTRGLDVAGGSSANGANVALYDYRGASNQRWVFEPSENYANIQVWSHNLYSNSSSFSMVGHAFIVITNPNAFSIYVGAFEIPANSRSTVGTWGNNEFKGIWYNNETGWPSDEEYVNCAVLSTDISRVSFSTMETYIANNNYWSITKNCSSFASGLWNSVSSVILSAGVPNTPQSLKNSIMSKSGWQYGEQIPIINPRGYYDNDGTWHGA